MLNEGEERCLAAYNAILEREGKPPSVRELMREYGCRSSSTVHAQIKKLREAGYPIPTRGRSHVDGLKIRPKVWHLGHEVEAALRQLDERKGTHLICKLRSVIGEFSRAATCTLLILLPMLLPGGAL